MPSGSVSGRGTAWSGCWPPCARCRGEGRGPRHTGGERPLAPQGAGRGRRGPPPGVPPGGLPGRPRARPSRRRGVSGGRGASWPRRGRRSGSGSSAGPPAWASAWGCSSSSRRARRARGDGLGVIPGRRGAAGRPARPSHGLEHAGGRGRPPGPFGAPDRLLRAQLRLPPSESSVVRATTEHARRQVSGDDSVQGRWSACSSIPRRAVHRVWRSWPRCSRRSAHEGLSGDRPARRCLRPAGGRLARRGEDPHPGPGGGCAPLEDGGLPGAPPRRPRRRAGNGLQRHGHRRDPEDLGPRGRGRWRGP